ncbi:MAG: RNA-binding S4 domain-containing protein [Gemmobacter sp.]
MAGKGASDGADRGARPADPPDHLLRLDKWLFQARFFRARGLAADLVEAGRCRVNGHLVRKSAHGVAVGDVLTFAQGGRIRVVRVLDLGARRGPASEARTLYLDLDAVAGDDGAPAVLE